MANRNPTLFHQGLRTLALAVESEAIRVCLLEPAAECQRLIAWITVKRDIHAALNGQIAAACNRLGERIERQLWDEEYFQPALGRDENAHMPALDALSAAVAPRPSMRVWLAGISETTSLATAREAVSATPSLIMGHTVLDNRLTSEGIAAELARTQTEVLVISGGYDEGRASVHHGLFELCEILDSAISAMTSDRLPLVIYAGSKQADTQVRSLFEAQEESLRLQVVDNVRPAANRTMLAALIRALQDERWRLVQRVSGIAALGRWVTPPARLTTLDWSFARMVQVWAEHFDLDDMHGVYNTAAWRQHVWVRQGFATVRMVYADPASPQPPPVGWPPIQLWSGPSLDDQGAPPRLRWLDRSGMAPLLATIGQISPAAMFQVLEQDVFGSG